MGAPLAGEGEEMFQPLAHHRVKEGPRRLAAAALPKRRTRRPGVTLPGPGGLRRAPHAPPPGKWRTTKTTALPRPRPSAEKRLTRQTLASGTAGTAPRLRRRASRPTGATRPRVPRRREDQRPEARPWGGDRDEAAVRRSEMERPHPPRPAKGASALSRRERDTPTTSRRADRGPKRPRSDSAASRRPPRRSGGPAGRSRRPPRAGRAVLPNYDDDYRDLGTDYFDRIDKTNAADRLVRRLRNLGFQVELKAA